jgi:hypothetical protein
MLGSLIAYAMDATAVSGDRRLLNHGSLTAAQARQCLADLDALPPLPVAADVIDRDVRLSRVWEVCALAGGELRFHPNDPRAQLRTPFRRAVDWNFVLRSLNLQLDEYVAAMRLPEPALWSVKLQELQMPRTATPRWRALCLSFLGMREPLSREFGEDFGRMYGAEYEGARVAQLQADSFIRLIQLGFALTAYQRETGAYPASLADLAPGILGDVPLDPCSGADFVYQPSESGFLLYSLGLNLKDDNGLSDDDQLFGDDFVLRVGTE